MTGKSRGEWVFIVVIVVLGMMLLSGVAVGEGPAIPKDHVISTGDLASVLQSKAAKPLILSVGPHMLYAQAHIKGAEYVGAASSPEGIAALKQRVKKESKSKAIVIYCGCCPWVHCPNVEPAYRELLSMGFTNVKVLFVPNNIGADWVYQGYPTIKGE
jgi:thiosulfate/3-mercaptopyruvate sulfurtransferase